MSQSPSNPSFMTPANGAMPKLGIIQRFLIHISGVEPSIFEQYRVPLHERSTYAKLGLTLFIPFIFAMLAATVTLLSILGRSADRINVTLPVSLLFGFIWGLIIFFMDIAIMSQMTKWIASLDDTGKYHPGVRVPLSRKLGKACKYLINKPFEFIVPTLRLMAAAVLGVVMSHTIVLEIFSATVDRVVNQEREALENASLKSMKAKTDMYDAEIKKREDEVTRVTSGADEALQALEAENAATGNTKPPVNADRDKMTTDLLTKDVQGAVLLKQRDDADVEFKALALQLPILRSKELQLKKDLDDEERNGDPTKKRGSGRGPIWEAINKNLLSTAADLTKAEARVASLDALLKTTRSKLDARLTEVLQAMDDTHRKAAEAQKAAIMKSFEGKSELRNQQSQMRLDRLREEIENYSSLRKQAKEANDASIQKMRTDTKNQSYDILERTIALHRLIFEPESLSLPTDTEPAPAVAGATATAPKPAAVSPELAQMEARKFQERSRTLLYSWVAILLVFFILDTLPVFIKFMRRVTCIDILMQRQHNEFRDTPLEDLGGATNFGWHQPPPSAVAATRIESQVAQPAASPWHTPPDRPA